MKNVKHLTAIGSVIQELNDRYQAGTIEKMIVIIQPTDQDAPRIAFCETGAAEELGLLEMAKIQAFKTRNIID